MRDVQQTHAQAGTRLARGFWLAVTAAALGGCALEAAYVAQNDPGAFECRARAAQEANVGFSETASGARGTNVMGVSRYDIVAGELAWRCDVDAAGAVVALAPVRRG